MAGFYFLYPVPAPGSCGSPFPNDIHISLLLCSAIEDCLYKILWSITFIWSPKVAAYATVLHCYDNPHICRSWNAPSLARPLFAFEYALVNYANIFPYYAMLVLWVIPLYYALNYAQPCDCCTCTLSSVRHVVPLRFYRILKKLS